MTKILFLCLLLFRLAPVCLGSNITDPEQLIVKADSGDAKSQAVLGAMYRRGEFGERDYAKAYYWLEKASSSGEPIAQYNLAVMYESGNYVDKDTAMAAELYDTCYQAMYQYALEGNSRAQVNLGNLMELGYGGTPGIENAMQWYNKAAENGDARAQYIMGYKYYHGWGLTQSYDSALKWFEQASDQDYPAARHTIGNMYFNGTGVERDIEKANEYHRLAEANHLTSEKVDSTTGSYGFNGMVNEGDKVIPGLLPPDFLLEIDEGSCGEACLQSIINSHEFRTSQIEINRLGGSPGRGLHTDELYKALDHYGIKYVDKLNKSYLRYALEFFNPVNWFSDFSDEYRDYLYNIIIPKIKEGHPVILGIKIYPDEHSLWDCDHFILLVGYNEETDELIYNDNNRRKRISAEKLLDKSSGYSIINRYNFFNYLEIDL